MRLIFLQNKGVISHLAIFKMTAQIDMAIVVVINDGVLLSQP
jgi:hypothetical protein